MSFIETLKDAAVADTDVLRRLDEGGDRFELFRDVDFVLVTKDPDTANALRDFINDYQFGYASLGEDSTEVRVIVHMPVTQNVIFCITGFMRCIAKEFDAELDGWGCFEQSDT